MGCRNITVLRASAGAIVIMGLLWFLFVGILANRVAKTTRISLISSTRTFKLKRPWDFMRQRVGGGLHDVNHVNVVSKRRVPSGPDPIHNRRVATNSRQPPGFT